MKKDDEVKRLRGLLSVMKEQIEDDERSWELRVDADRRAISRWQATSGRTMVWPDHADLCVWLMERLAIYEDLREALEADAMMDCNGLHDVAVAACIRRLREHEGAAARKQKQRRRR